MDPCRCGQALKILKPKLRVRVISFPKNEFLSWVFILHFQFSFSIFRIAWDSVFLKFLRNGSEKPEKLLDVSGNGCVLGGFSWEMGFRISFSFLPDLRTENSFWNDTKRCRPSSQRFWNRTALPKFFSKKAVNYQWNIQTFGCWSGFGNCRMCTFASNKIRCSLWLATLSFCKLISKNTE